MASNGAVSGPSSVSQANAGGSTGALVLQDGHGNRIALSNGKVTIKAPVVEIDATVITFTGPGYRRIVVANNNPI